MTSPNAAGCAAHLNQLQQNDCYYYNNDCSQDGEEQSPSVKDSGMKSIVKTCTVVENGRVVVKPIPG